MIDTNYDYIKCTVDQGVRYLDNKGLRNIINDFHRYKSRGKVIYIIATVICHLANGYGGTFLAFPFAVGNFGLTNVYQTVRKGFVSILLGGFGPLVVIGGPVALIVASILVMSGLRLAFSNLDFIPTNPVDVTKDLEARIAGISEVIVGNNRDKMIMGEPVQENQKCWFPDQHLLNPHFKVKPSEIPDTLDSVLPDLRYEEAVNMQDITGLDRVELTDKLDLGKTKPSISKPRKGKEVSFLKKFGDSGPIGESDKWDTCENEFVVPEKRYLRTRNEP